MDESVIQARCEHLGAFAYLHGIPIIANVQRARSEYPDVDASKIEGWVHKGYDVERTFWQSMKDGLV